MVNYPLGRSATWCAKDIKMFRLSCELHSSEGKGYREKWTSGQAQTWDLCSIAEFQPHELPVPVEILCPQSPFSTTWVTDHDTASLTSKWYVLQIHRFTHAAYDSVLTNGYTFLPPYRWNELQRICMALQQLLYSSQMSMISANLATIYIEHLMLYSIAFSCTMWLF